MQRTPQQLQVVREHMGWARTYAIYWLIMCLGVFGAAYGIAEFTDFPAELRIPLLIMIGTILIVNAVWQAAGLAIIRLEEVVLPRGRY